ncbi:unnamed protein product [Danaus chrysippus]|uniref:(African queen) hypothetical protein n=1 Tax=Danaus chrysippus TaxID=151541 RepID=A0A8J2QMF0_9NEOP|nr:unnamed protein product [Danaus chrysippus]
MKAARRKTFLNLMKETISPQKMILTHSDNRWKTIKHDETEIKRITEDTRKININDENNEVPKLVEETVTDDLKDSRMEEVDVNSQKYRLKMIEKTLSDVRTMRSYTSASTIAPEVVKQQVKKNLEAKQKKAVAKGEASAVTRQRRDNRETIRESHGIWGWDE